MIPLPKPIGFVKQLIQKKNGNLCDEIKSSEIFVEFYPQRIINTSFARPIVKKNNDEVCDTTRVLGPSKFMINFATTRILFIIHKFYHKLKQNYKKGTLQQRSLTFLFFAYFILTFILC